MSKNIQSSLQTRSIYIVHENIEASHPNEPAVYSIVTDAPVYKMEIDYSAHSNHCSLGYCRLRQSEVITKPVPCEGMSRDIESIDSIENDDEDFITERMSFSKSKLRDSLLLHLRSRNQVCGTPSNVSKVTTSESASPGSSEYDYVYAYAFSSRQPLSAMKLNKSSISVHSSTLPSACLTRNNFASEHFLNSKAFLLHFMQLFQEKLGGLLNISSEEMAHATWMGASIYGKTWQVMPSIASPWPKEAFEWIHRHREIIQNPITGQKFQWPNREIVNKVTSFGCHVIPVNSPQTKTSFNREIEWKIVFPDAERYLESCLTNTQIKIFVIVLVLIKTHVEPHIDEKLNQLTAEHLRSHLFWQCEQNCAAWPEDHLGEALMRYLNSLLVHLRKQKLPDYFLPSRNLFESVPSEVLVELHRRIFRIVENPSVHFIAALRNLRFSARLSPLLNFRKVYAAMTVDNPLKIINPMFRTEKDRFDDIDDERNERKSRRVAFADQQECHKQERRISTETIDLKLTPAQHTDQLRRIILFELFIFHFIEMSKSFLQNRSWNLSLIYLKQASRLCGLLAEDGYKPNADKFLSQIDKIHRSLMTERNRDAFERRPRLPQRLNSLHVEANVLLQPECETPRSSPIVVQKFKCVNFSEDESGSEDERDERNDDEGDGNTKF